MSAVLDWIVNEYYRFIGVMRSFGVADLIDILVVAFLIYKLVQLVRQTRAKQLVGGIVALVMAWFVAEIFEMTTLSVVLRAIIGSGFIALVVIFQPEIRNVLEQVSLTNFSKFNRKGHSEYAELDTCIDNVSRACGEMSKSKTGALIVFEQETRLGDIIKTGTVIDAQSSMEVITNVFYPKAPLHDGAMIIRGARVYAAGCILPLSQNSNLSKDLGTRHRASLGMSENSDAIVVVVSEETGIISVAKDGNLKRNLTASELLEYLKNALIKEEENTESKFTFTAIKNAIKKGVKKNDE
ncbi:MAG: diadenylate cyclase CdaA [Clostridia bacterium]|nr:diadenylate cyclase CdaA [Clostridia bacterium]